MNSHKTPQVRAQKASTGHNAEVPGEWFTEKGQGTMTPPTIFPYHNLCTCSRVLFVTAYNAVNVKYKPLNLPEPQKGLWGALVITGPAVIVIGIKNGISSL